MTVRIRLLTIRTIIARLTAINLQYPGSWKVTPAHSNRLHRLGPQFVDTCNGETVLNSTMLNRNLEVPNISPRL